MVKPFVDLAGAGEAAALDSVEVVGAPWLANKSLLG